MKKFIAYFSPLGGKGKPIPGIEFEAPTAIAAEVSAIRYAKEKVIELNAVVDIEEFTAELFKAAA